jgi:exodeoxyribonuclease-3
MHMKIITLNVNGIRSAHKKGLFRWLANQNADVICMQEVRAVDHILEQAEFQLPEYYQYFQCAQKSGYSGVGLLTRVKPDKVVKGLGFELCDHEGRYIHAEFGPLTVASIYFPSGTTGDARQAQKYIFMQKFETILDTYLSTNRKFILCGDWNIAHKNIDLKNWRSNQKHTGFLPEERAWLDVLFDKKGLVDAFRVVNQEADQYTWWSNFGRSWEKNVGWRIDYQMITSNLKSAVKSAHIYKEERFSDHAPLVMEYEIE